MIRSKRLRIVFILFFVLGVAVFSQDKQQGIEDKDKGLREEILAVYQSKGEQGLRDFFKEKGKEITGKFIVDFAEAGVNERKEEWLKACEIMAEEKKDEKTLADVLYKTGEYFRLISEFKKADDYFDKAFQLYVKMNDSLGQGDVYLRQGLIYAQIGENTRAFEKFDKALPLLEKAGNAIPLGNLYQSKGGIYFTIGDVQKATEMFDKALQYFEKGMDMQGQGNIFMRKGMIYFYYTGENSKAFEMYDKALILFEKLKDPICLGQVYSNKGDFYFRTGESSKAIEIYEKALIFFENAKELLGQGRVYRSLGDIYFYSGDIARAKEMSDKALSFFVKAGSAIEQGNVFQTKGDIYFSTGEYSKALAMYTNALVLYEKEGNPMGQGNIYLSKGDIYLSTGEYSKALDMYEKAFSFFKNSYDTLGQGNIYYRKGDTYLAKGEYSKALEMYDNALPLLLKADTSINIGNIYWRKGIIYSQMKDKNKAFEMYDKAMFIFNTTKYSMGEGNVYQSEGDTYFSLGDNEDAIEMYDRAISIFKKIGYMDGESYTIYGKAKSFAKRGINVEALALFEESISKIEKIRTQTPLLEMRRTLLERLYDVYDKTALFMMNNKYYEKAFKDAESMRARVFLDQMTEGLVGLGKGLKPDLKAERDLLVGKLSVLSRQMHETPSNDEKKLQELKEEYRKVESQFDDLLIKIRLENPLYASVNYPQPIPVQDLQKDILKDGETLLSYFISQDETYAFVVSKNNFHVQPLKIKEKELNGFIKRYLTAIKENNLNDMNKYGNRLYEKLFNPLEKYLVKNSDIIIVPAGQLEKIPFESFIIDNKKPGPPVYLLEKYRLKYIQSATLLSILRKNYNGDSTAKGFIGFGDPVYDYENFKQGKPEQGTATKAPSHQGFFYNNIFGVPLCLSAFVAVSKTTEKEEEVVDEIKEIHRDRFARAGGVMDRLPQSGVEIQSIAQLFEKESLATKVYLRDQAAEENARANNMKDFAYIHFSCHGLLNDDFQCLVLSQLPGSKEDGYFTLNEIMNCDYNAKLIVLSACQTGSGKMARGEGITGLTRAFMYAGSPAVVASLWDVDDAATKELMVKFYSNMLEKNLDKVEALRQAKLELLKNEKYSSPLSWSAFVMYGE